MRSRSGGGRALWERIYRGESERWGKRERWGSAWSGEWPLHGVPPPPPAPCRPPPGVDARKVKGTRESLCLTVYQFDVLWCDRRVRRVYRGVNAVAASELTRVKRHSKRSLISIPDQNPPCGAREPSPRLATESMPEGTPVAVPCAPRCLLALLLKGRRDRRACAATFFGHFSQQGGENRPALRVLWHGLRLTS